MPDLGRVAYEAFRDAMLAAHPTAAAIYLPFDDLAEDCREANRAAARAVARVVLAAHTTPSDN